MLNTTMGTRGMVTAPHHMAAEAGRDVLRENGTATEAMVAAAAVIAGMTRGPILRPGKRCGRFWARR